MAKLQKDSVLIRDARERAKISFWLAGMFFIFAGAGWWYVQTGHRLTVRGWAGLIAFTGAPPCLLLAGLRGSFRPENDAMVKKVAAKGSRVLEEVEAILEGSVAHTRFDSLRFNSNWIVSRSDHKTEVFRADDVTWVYALNSEVRIYNSKGELMTHYWDDHEVNQRIRALIEVCPNALFGYHEGLQRRFMSKPSVVAPKMHALAKLGQRNAAELEPGLHNLTKAH